MAGVGDKFEVTEEVELRTEDGARLLARYLVGERYRITARNFGAVLKLIVEKRATPVAAEGGGPGNRIGAAQARLSGAAKT